MFHLPDYKTKSIHLFQPKESRQVSSCYGCTISIVQIYTSRRFLFSDFRRITSATMHSPLTPFHPQLEMFSSQLSSSKQSQKLTNRLFKGAFSSPEPLPTILYILPNFQQNLQKTTQTTTYYSNTKTTPKKQYESFHEQPWPWPWRYGRRHRRDGSWWYGRWYGRDGSWRDGRRRARSSNDFHGVLTRIWPLGRHSPRNGSVAEDVEQRRG
jgi:hypothetical protein